MKVGDLVREKPQGVYLVETHKRRMGVIVEIDPLRKAIMEHRGGPFADTTTVELIILLSNGTRWYAAPCAWEVISEGR